MSRPKSAPTGNPRTKKRAAQPPATVEKGAQPAAIPCPPDDLGAVGREVWANLWAANGEAYNGRTDAYVVARYCRLQDRYAALLAAVARDGLLSVGSKGQTVVHPAARMLSDVERQLSSLEAVLGLTPESRLRLGISAIERESKLDAFIRRHG